MANELHLSLERDWCSLFDLEYLGLRVTHFHTADEGIQANSH